MQTIQNGSSITIDRVLTEEEFNSIKTLLFSYCKIGQVYFKDSVDIKTINEVKNLLEISPTQDDASIDKYVLLSDANNNFLNDIVTRHPDTWQISYQKEGNCYMLTTLPKYRNMIMYINKLIDDVDLVDSQLEKMMILYDEMKKYLVLENIYNDRIPDAIITKKGSQATLNRFFSTMLDRIGVKNYCLGYKDSSNNKKSLVVAEVNDDKHKVKGFYYFAPLEEINKDRYHFFCITSSKVLRYIKLFYPDDIMELYNLSDKDSFEHKLNYLIKTKQDSKTKEVESVFKVSSKVLNDQLIRTPNITVGTLYNIYKNKEKQVSINAMSEEMFVENSKESYFFRPKKMQIKIKK